MAHKDNAHPILQEIKNTAKDHQAFEKERGKDLIYGHALDIASKKLVNVDWNTACAMAKNGTLPAIDEPFKQEPIVQIHFPDVREGVYFPHQIGYMARQMELGTFDGKGKTIRFPDVDPLTKEVAEATREQLKALVESGEMIDAAGMNDDEIIKAFYDVIDQNKEEYTPVLIPANEAHSYFDKTSDKIEGALKHVREGLGTNILQVTQSLSDFAPSSKKVFYSKRNHLMSEYVDLLKDPMYEEIPYEIETIEKMGSWAKNNGGIFFYPTASIADLENKSDEQAGEIIKANFNTMLHFNLKGDSATYDFSTNHNNSFIIGQSGSGQSFFIKDLIQKEQKENPSFTEEEVIRFVYKKYQIRTVLDQGESYESIILSAKKDNMKNILQGIPNDELIKLVNMPITINSAISMGRRPNGADMIEKLSMIRDEADKRGLEYVIAYRDDIGVHEELTNKMLTEVRKHGESQQKGNQNFFKHLNNKHIKSNFRKPR